MQNNFEYSVCADGTAEEVRQVNDVAWLRVSDKPCLAPDELHLWRGSVDIVQSCEAGLLAMLSQDERARVGRFRLAPDRQRSLLARAMLRDILSSYLDCDPQQLRFTATAQGKPLLDSSVHASTGVRFSVSHSGGVVLLAFANQCDVGVDVERIRDDVEATAIAERYFAEAEAAELRGMAAADRVRAFFRIWTRKEAYLKARGTGISGGLGRFRVSVTPDMAELLSDEDHPAEASNWHLQDVEPGPDYAAAVAVNRHGLAIRSFEWRKSLD